MVPSFTLHIIVRYDTAEVLSHGYQVGYGRLTVSQLLVNGFEEEKEHLFYLYTEISFETKNTLTSLGILALLTLGHLYLKNIHFKDTSKIKKCYNFTTITGLTIGICKAIHAL